MVPDQTNNGDGPDFIVLYVLGTANIDEIGVIENEKDEILPFPTDRTLPAQCYRIPSIHSYHRKTMTTKETLGAAASSRYVSYALIYYLVCFCCFQCKK